MRKPPSLSDAVRLSDHLRRQDYEFAFNARELGFLVAGLGLLAILIFTGGVSVGTRLPAARARQPQLVQAAEVPEPVPVTADLGVTVLEVSSLDLSGIDGPDPDEAAPGHTVLDDAVQDDTVLGETVPEETAEPDLTAEVRSLGETVETIFELQLALFFRRGDAEEALAGWRERGYEPYVVEVSSSTGVPRYTLRLGPYPSMDEAVKEQAALAENERSDSVIRFRDSGRAAKEP
ncbi:MAG: SPOR domain-containing protein [Acidobacteria bacterium]|nr:SPOR domain-containing protein [Acidobacteriota bacterium]